jgi:succinoglycan biosynthesis protein ExoA
LLGAGAVLNEERQITASVTAMLRQRFPGRIEFLLVDGGSTDRTPELLRDLAKADDRIRLLENPRRLTPSGLNIALRHARGRWVARMDAHTEYPEDYLAQGVERLKRGDTRWVAGPQVAKGHGPVSSAVALALQTPLGRGGSRRWGHADASAGAEYELDSGVFTGVWNRETVLQYGGWDERWIRNQDAEMAGRFLANGERLVCVPSMAATYTPRNTLSSLWRQYFQWGEFRDMTAVRHPHTLRRSHLLTPGLPVAAAAAVAAPRTMRRAARRGLGLYVAALAAAGVKGARDAEQPRDAVLVPVVLAVMHLGNGLGMLTGAVRHGPPLHAIAATLGLDGLVSRLATPPNDVYAPSLVASD